MGLFDKFKKTKKPPSPKKKPPETLSEVIAQEVEKTKRMTPAERQQQRINFEVKKKQSKKQEKLLSKWVDNNTQGEQLEENGKIDEAIKCYESNVKSKADTPFTYDRLASLYHMKYEFEKERNTLKLFIERCNSNPRVNERYKTDNVNRLQNVEQFLNTGKWKFDCLPSDPKPIYKEIKKAKKILKESNKERGVSKLENIMENGTFNNTVYNTLFQTYKKDKQFDDCIRVCNKAIEVLGFFSNDRKERWTINLEKAVKMKEKG